MKICQLCYCGVTHSIYSVRSISDEFSTLKKLKVITQFERCQHGLPSLFELQSHHASFTLFIDRNFGMHRTVGHWSHEYSLCIYLKENCILDIIKFPMKITIYILVHIKINGQQIIFGISDTPGVLKGYQRILFGISNVLLELVQVAEICLLSYAISEVLKYGNGQLKGTTLRKNWSGPNFAFDTSEPFSGCSY